MSHRTLSCLILCRNHEIICFTTEHLHFFMVTSSHLHPKYEPLGTKIAPSATAVVASSPSVANRGIHQTVAGLVFGTQNGQHCNLILSIHLHGEFIAYVVAIL